MHKSGPWGVITKQALIGLVGVVPASVIAGLAGALGFAAGAGCVAIPSAYFAWSSQRTMEPGRIVVQGITKVLCTGVFMAIVIASDTVEPLWFFAGLIASQGGYWWALVDQDEKSAKKAEIKPR